MENNDQSANQNDESPEDTSVSLLEVIEQERAIQEEYCAVLGASDENHCSFQQGVVKRQALYSCLTCCPEARTNLDKCAGVCLACTYQCHENHDLVELYTKRNFRCDCPTVKFDNKCTLNPTLEQPQPQNVKNLYGQNFQGLYCTCHRPYPDPEYEGKEIMLQCTICEDWYHLEHLNASPESEKLTQLRTSNEMICEGCMTKYDFLRDYTIFSLKALEDLDEVELDVAVTSDETVMNREVEGEDNDNKLRSELDKSISDIMNMSEQTDAEKPTKSIVGAKQDTIAEPERKRAKIEVSEIAEKLAEKPAATETVDECKRPKGKGDYEKGPTFWRLEWRAELCRCSNCLKLYADSGVEYLLDDEDSVVLYEERGMKRADGDPVYEEGMRALASWDRVKQIDAITGYNRLKDRLKEFLQTFAANNKVVTVEDVTRFFDEMRNENTSNVGQPYFCR